MPQRINSLNEHSRGQSFCRLLCSSLRFPHGCGYHVLLASASQVLLSLENFNVLQILKEERKKKKKKTTQAAKSSSHQLRRRGHLGRKAPSPEKKRAVSEDQEGCGQTSQQTSPDWFEGEENAREIVWSVQAYEHSAQNELESEFLDSANQGQGSSEEPKCEECK